MDMPVIEFSSSDMKTESSFEMTDDLKKEIAHNLF